MIPGGEGLAVLVLDHRLPEVALEIHRLEQAAYAVERDLIAYPEFPPLRVTMEDIRAEPDVFLGCREAGALVGVLSYSTSTRPGWLDIGRLVVDPGRFRRGIAGRLLQAAAERAGALGLTVSTAERNHPAVALYRKHGFSRSERTVLPDGLVLVRFHRKAPGTLP